MESDGRHALHAAIARKLAAGTLPLDNAARVRATDGTGQPCDPCGSPIRKGQVEYENTMADGRTFRFHAHCLASWHVERARARP